MTYVVDLAVTVHIEAEDEDDAVDKVLKFYPDLEVINIEECNDQEQSSKKMVFI
jgi:uncharacterized protein (DUF433 family)